MIPARPIRNVLAAVDLYSAPQSFVQNVAKFAAATGADLHFLHSHQDGSEAGVRAEGWLDTQRKVHQKRFELRELLADALPAGEQPKTARVGVGSAAKAILEDARDCRADLVILGPHRPHQIGDRYLGSTAERVLTEATVPCLILNTAMPWPVRRILVPADFSAPSRSALRCGIGWIRALSDRGAVEIDFVHVTGSSASAADRDGSAIERKLELEDEVQTILAEAAVKVPVHVHVLDETNPVEGLIRFAANRGTDLLIMGTRGNSIFVRALLGSVSSGMLRRADLPLLLVPPLAFAELRPDSPAQQPVLEIQPPMF